MRAPTTSAWAGSVHLWDLTRPEAPPRVIELAPETLPVIADDAAIVLAQAARGIRVIRPRAGDEQLIKYKGTPWALSADGRFVVGKAQSNPGDESLAIYNSSVDALAHWGREVDDVYPELVTCVYSGTAMLNRILMRKGLDVGLICNRGFEQIHSMGRALQSYLGYALEDRIHLNTHRYDEPLVPVSRTRGVTERTDVQGRIVIPLREDEVIRATRELVEAGSQAIVICLLQSHKNETSEQRARDLVREELKKLKSDIPVFASVDYYPSRKESHRMNTTILEAYGAEPSRQTLKKVSDRFKKHGAKFDLRVMATHGGTISWKAKELARTIVSGPIGGVIGSKLLGEYLGDENIACSDIGGTSFDVALITKGSFAIKSDPDMARLVLSLPLVAMDSVGAGAGSFVRLDPYSKSIKLGPDSAGYRVGTCWPESGLDTVSVSDCHVVLGYLNPQNFLGGAIKLDVQRARDHIKAQIADPLGLSVEDAAAGVIELLDLTLSEYLRANISAKGYNPAEFTCFSYGGAGPVHTYGYTEGVGFKDVVVPAWAAGFSAFRVLAVTDRGGTASDEKLATGNKTEFIDQPTAVTSLDSIMEREKLPRVDFIRCDVEGAEIRFIEGGKKTIERDLPSLLIEIHPFSLQRNFSSSGEAVRDYFLSLGYRMWQLNDDNSHMFESTQIDPKRRWKDYFLIHPSRASTLAIVGARGSSCTNRSSASTSCCSC